jgi:RNA polymerase sigma-70 factor, ECF subfamily
MDETSLITAAKTGDLNAFNQLVLQFQEAVYNQSFYILHDPAKAEDVTQDAFIQAFQSIKHYRGGSFRAWLMRIATNASIDEYRRMKRHPMLTLEPLNEDGEAIDAPGWLVDSSASVEEIVEYGEEKKWILQALERLPVDFRTALLLVDIQQVNYDEAAAILSIPVGTLKSRLARARVRMRESLERTSRNHDWWLNFRGQKVH